ncbi:MAG: type III-B CRISPR-associated protein Cas10/Cmr2, partial [Candidatus Korarchaeum sp.]|nr:type III-B CRISPR-associated protein Cas10/Cmr2 [Candidatus Korarchaeum sp.]
MRKDHHNFWKVKLCALLHDPPLKAYTIGKHKDLAEALLESFGVDCSELEGEEVVADVLAAASDRIPSLKFNRTLVEWSYKDQHILYHPLSGGRSENLLSESSEVLHVGGVASVKQENLREVSRELSRNFEEVHDRIVKKLESVGKRITDFRRKFLWLWRNMESIHGEKGFRGFVLSWLPADTRLPDHSIYDHLVTASALTVQDPVLVGIDIGGVQDFIKQSRKVRDLWASSYIVSMLSMAAMMVVVEELGPDSVIYPDLRGVPLVDLYLLEEEVLDREDLLRLWESEERFFEALLTPSIPGSFVFIAPRSKADDLLGRIKERVKVFFEELLTDTFRRLRLNPNVRCGLPYPLSLRSYAVPILEVEGVGSLRLGSDRDKIKEELKRLIPEEVYESFSSDGRNLLDHLTEFVVMRNETNGYDITGTFLYQVAYSVLQLGMASHKLASDFSYAEEPSVEGGEAVRRRCRLCGLRNHLPEWSKLVNKLRQDSSTSWAGWLLEEDEPLCPVCLTKRLLRSFHKEEGGPLFSLWGKVLKSDGRVLKFLLKGIGLDDSKMSDLLRIPTLDDIAISPIRKTISERLRRGELTKEEWERVSSSIASGVRAAIMIYYRSKDESDAKRYSHQVISEVLRELSKEVKGVEVIADYVAERLKEFKDPLKVPGTYYFPSIWENLLASASREGFGSEEIKKLKELLENLKGLYEKLGIYPSNYVTYVLSDGDRLGHWISGRMFLEEGISLSGRLHPSLRAKLSSHNWVSRLITPSLHRTMSRMLRELAQEVYPKIVSSLDGFVFYSGGDDLLAVVPSIKTLNMLETLQSCYSAEVIKLGSRVLMSMGRLATLSSGVVIAHRLLPMSEVLD